MKTCKKCGGVEWYANYCCKACTAERTKKYRAGNPEKVREQHAKYNAENKEKLRAYNAANSTKICARVKIWVSINREKTRKYKATWVAANKEKVLAKDARHRAIKLRATPDWANEFFVEEIYRLAILRSKTTGCKWHVDHIVPLKSKLVCGLHWEGNMQVISAKQNQIKSNKYWPDMP